MSPEAHEAPPAGPRLYYDGQIFPLRADYGPDAFFNDIGRNFAGLDSPGPTPFNPVLGFPMIDGTTLTVVVTQGVAIAYREAVLTATPAGGLPF